MILWFQILALKHYNMNFDNQMTIGKQTARFLIGRHQGQKWWGSGDAAPFKLKLSAFYRAINDFAVRPIEFDVSAVSNHVTRVVVMRSCLEICKQLLQI